MVLLCHTQHRTNVVLLVAAASDDVADVSSHFAAVSHLQPYAVVHGLRLTVFLSLRSIFVCAITFCCDTLKG